MSPTISRELTPSQKAKRTAKWAVTMTKWLMTRLSAGTPWQVVAFCGAGGGESRGIVDLVAIRKDHRIPSPPLKRGDLFEMILIQVKGGTAVWPNAEDVERLRRVAKKYKARHVLLAEWKKGARPRIYRLSSRRTAIAVPWEHFDDPLELFR